MESSDDVQPRLAFRTWEITEQYEAQLLKEARMSTGCIQNGIRCGVPKYMCANCAEAHGLIQVSTFHKRRA